MDDMFNNMVTVSPQLVAMSTEAPSLAPGATMGASGAPSHAVWARPAGAAPLFECQNGTVKNRIKTVLGFNSENPALLFLFIIHYNFVCPHMCLNGKTPAEAMGIRVDGDDKWATPLAFASAC